MCGIVGEMRFDSSPAREETIRTMLGAVAHRGPDGSGTVCLGPTALGHARLAIVDLSSDGAQPMANEDGAVWVTFNGEIYNYRQLRAELTVAGHTFKSRSDTEVLVHLYEEHGIGLVDRLRGMSALALWGGRACLRQPQARLFVSILLLRERGARCRRRLPLCGVGGVSA